jgi:hypothetical protein
LAPSTVRAIDLRYLKRWAAGRREPADRRRLPADAEGWRGEQEIRRLGYGLPGDARSP